MGEAVEQVGVFVVGRAQHDPAVAGEDIHVENRFMDQAVAERACLDPHAGGGATEGDRFQLRYDHRHTALLQCRRGEDIIGDRAFRLDPTGCGIDAEDVIEGPNVERSPRMIGAVAEQIGARFRKSNGGGWGTAQFGGQALAARCVVVHGCARALEFLSVEIDG